MKTFLLRGSALAGLSLLFVSTNCLVPTSILAQSGQLSGSALRLNGSTSGAVTIAIPSGLTSSFTIPLPDSGAAFPQIRYLCDSGGLFKWRVPAAGATGGVKDSVTTMQTTSNNSSYLFDVSYPPGATGPLKGAAFVSEISDKDNHPSFADNDVYANNTNTSSASSVTVNAMNVIVADSGSGTQIGIQAEAYGKSNNFAMILNGGNVGIGTSTPAQTLEVNGNIRISGKNGLKIIEGANGTKGTASLLASTSSVTVSTNRVTANSRIFLTAGPSANAGNLGAIYVSARTAGTSFVIHTTAPYAGGAIPISWLIVEPGP